MNYRGYSPNPYQHSPGHGYGNRSPRPFTPRSPRGPQQNQFSTPRGHAYYPRPSQGFNPLSRPTSPRHSENGSNGFSPRFKSPNSHGKSLGFRSPVEDNGFKTPQQSSTSSSSMPAWGSGCSVGSFPRKSFTRNFEQTPRFNFNDGDNIEKYYQHSMVEDPWRTLKPVPVNQV